MEIIKLIGSDSYRMMFKPSASVTYVAAALFNEHIDDLPRFCNAWIERQANEELRLVVLARIGQKYHNQKTVMGEYADQTVYTNHGCYLGFEDGLNFIADGESKVDDSYGKYYFTIPSEWEKDFYLLLSGKLFDDLSNEFQRQIIKVYSLILPVLRKVKIKVESEYELHKKMIDVKNHPLFNFLNNLK